MTSLFRYALCATSRGADGVHVRAESGAFDARVDYELSPDVEILPDLHDCQFVIERIKGMDMPAGLLDDASAGDRALCVIVFSDGGTTSYRIDSAAEPIVRLFQQRRSCHDAKRLLADALGVDQFDGGFLEDIARAGIIVPSPESPAKRDASLAANA